MLNPSGSITINGINDEEMLKIWEIKVKHEGAFTFNPQQFQQTGAVKPTYNNVVFQWNAEKGLEAMHSIVSMLLKKEAKAEAVGQ